MASTEQQSKSTWIIIAIIAIAALFIGIHLQHRKESEFKLQHGIILPSPIPLASFHLTDDQGKIFTNRDLMGHWSLLFFGFTHCLAPCTQALHELDTAYKQIEDSNQHITPQVIFVSIDPKRDTPKLIRNYLASFNRNFVGVTGNEIEIANLTSALSHAYLKSMQTMKKNSLPKHSGTIIVINPSGEWVAALATPYQGKIIASDFNHILQQL